MPHSRRSTTIARDPHDVFLFLANPTNAPRWLPVTVSRGRDGSVTGVGSRVTQHLYHPLGLRFAATYEITRWDPDRSIAFTVGGSGRVRTEGEVVLTPAGPESTCVTFDLRSRTRGRGRLTAPLLAPFLRWIAASIDNARGVLEAGRGARGLVGH